MTDDERFLDRWSRRKTGARTETKDETPAPVEPDATPAAAPTITSQPVDPETLPDIDSLNADSDFSAFMQDGVPEALRNRALRKLWQTDPAFNVVDGLLEYGEDYTDIAAIAETVQSLYKVGKGLVGEDRTDAAASTDTPEDPELAERTETGTPETMPKRHHTTTPGEISEDRSTAKDEDDKSNV